MLYPVVIVNTPHAKLPCLLRNEIAVGRRTVTVRFWLEERHSQLHAAVDKQQAFTQSDLLIISGASFGNLKIKMC